MNILNKFKSYIALAVILLSVITVAASQGIWGAILTSISRNNLTASLAQANSSTTPIEGDVSVNGNLTISGASSTAKLHLFEKAPNNFMITSNVDQNGVKDAGLGGVQYTQPYTNWINFEPLVLKLINSENGTNINNMIQINPVRTEFGPPGGSGPDQDKRIGPSNERMLWDGVDQGNPSSANQVYQLLLPTVNGINGEWRNVVPVCLNPTVPGHIEQCGGPIYKKVIGVTQEEVGPGGNVFFDTMGIARNVISYGKINIGDTLVLGPGNDLSRYLQADNTAPSTKVVGIALSSFPFINVAGNIDVLLGPRSYATSSIAIVATSTPIDHIMTTGATPIVTSCGTNPIIVGTNSAGKVTIGTSIGNDDTCIVTFRKSFPNAPACFANNESNSNAGHRVGTITTPTTLTIKVTNSFSSGDVISYGCLGY